MDSLLNLTLVGVVLTNLYLLGSSRLLACVRILAAQGAMLGLMVLVLPGHGIIRGLVLAALSTSIKCVLFPRLLTRAIQQADVRHEVEPYLGFGLSMVMGILALGGSIILSSRIPFPIEPEARLVLPVALMTLVVGLLLLISRKTALSQVIGYVVMENGIFIFGVEFARDEPLLIETGVLLDVFAVVFVMGITIFHISREFDHIDVDQLSSLKD